MSTGIAALLGGGGGCNAEIEAERVESRIVDGEETSEDPAVVAVLFFGEGGNLGICSGSLVGPTRKTVLTAAHCIPSGGGEVGIYFGRDPVAYLTDEDPDFIDLIPATAARVNTAFDLDDLLAGNDFAVVYMEEAAPVDPLPMNFIPLELGFDGLVDLDRRVRLVGFGADTVLFGEDGSVAGLDGFGPKRQGSATLADLSPTLLISDISGDQAGGCAGDSGGPILVSIGGQEYVAGVFSFEFGADACDSGNAHGRIDSHLGWIMAALATPPEYGDEVIHF